MKWRSQQGSEKTGKKIDRVSKKFYALKLKIEWQKQKLTLNGCRNLKENKILSEKGF